MAIVIQAELSGRNRAIVGLAVTLGIGNTQVPQSPGLFPEWVMMVFGRSAVGIATLVADGLNLTLPQKTPAEEQRERLAMEQEG